MAYTTSTAAPLPDDPAGLRAVVLLPVPKGQRTPSERSEAACRKLCMDNGFSVDEVLLDEGPRAKLDRPTMRTAFSLLARQQPDALVIYDWSQLSSNPAERREFEERMRRYGIAVYAVHNASAPHILWDPTDDRSHRVRRSG